MLLVIIAFMCCIYKGFAVNMSGINILFVNDFENEDAAIGVREAIKYMNFEYKTTINVKKVNGSIKDPLQFQTLLCDTYSQMLKNSTPPDAVLDTTKGGVISETVKAFSLSLGLPTITSSYGQKGDLVQWKYLNNEQSQYLLQILPPMEVIPDIIRQLVSIQNYTTAAILADSYYVMEHKYKSLLQNLPNRHFIEAINFVNPISQLIHIKHLKIFNMYVLGSLQSIKIVLDGADAISMFTKEFSWHAITHDRGNLRCECKKADIIFARPYIETKYKERFENIKTNYHLQTSSEISVGFYLDLALQTFHTVKNMKEVSKSLTTFIECADFNGTNTPSRTNFDFSTFFANENTPPAIAPISVIENGKSSMTFNLEVMLTSFVEGSSLKTKNLGTWNKTFGLTLTNISEVYDLAATTYYRIATVVQKPFVYEDPKTPKGFSGYCIDMIDEIADILMFDYEINEVVDQSVGTINDDGEWNGIMRELLERRADIGLSTISISGDRSQVVDFTVPFYDTVGHSILMKIEPTPTSFTRFLAPFEIELWLYIIMFYFIASFLIWVFYRLSPFGLPVVKHNKHMRKFTLVESLWFCLISFTPQGAGRAPNYTSGLIVAGCWWLFVYIMISCYCANLSAFLTVSRLESPVKSLDDLINQYKIQYAPLNGSETMKYFEKMAGIEEVLLDKWKDLVMNDSLSAYERSKFGVWEYPLSTKYTKLWKNMLAVGLPNTMEEAIERVRKSKSVSEGFAYLGDATDVKYLELTYCDLFMVGEEFHKKSYAIAVQKGSPLRDKFNNAILSLFNRRQIEMLKEKWWSHNPNRVFCDYPIVSDSIGIENIGGIFIFLWTLVAAFIVVCIIRYFWRRHKNKLQIH